MVSTVAVPDRTFAFDRGEKMRIAHLLLMVSLLLSAGCSDRSSVRDGNSRLLRIKGSDSMYLLVQRWAEAYMRKQKDVSIYVEGGGSGTGIQTLIDGSVDICASSRPMTSKEVQQLATRYNSIGVSILGARDALGIIVHPSNPVAGLSLEEIKKIYTGEITSWKEVGGSDHDIIPFSREPNSGTYLYFDEHVLFGAAYARRCVYAPGARSLVDSVANNPYGIGYGTIAYAQNVRLVAVNGYSLTAENVRNGTYPILRYLYLYTVQPPEGAAKNFINWLMSGEGQRIVKENGYIPLYEVN